MRRTKKHFYGHISRNYGIIISMCNYSTPDRFLSKFTTIDALGRGHVKKEDVCLKCWKINMDFEKGLRCCTDPICRGNRTDALGQTYQRDRGRLNV